MNLTLTHKKNELESVFQSRDLVELANIYEKECSIAIWKRRPIPEIQEEFKNIQLRPFLTKEIVTIDSYQESEIYTHLDEMGFVHLPKDIFHLLEIYSDLFDSQRMGLRFAVLDTALCPKFHTDFLGVRLLCTYSGRGTEYVSGTEENRAKLRSQIAHDSMEVFPNKQRTSRYDVVLLKGEYFPGNEGFGAIHRSPQVTGKNRIFLSIDAVN